MTNKKIIIGFAIAFIISLNIYNIPFKQDHVTAAPTVEEFRDEKAIDIKALNKAVNKSMKKVVNLNKYDHVIVSFWATWCPSCRRENLIFNQFTKKNKNVLILGICVDKDPKALGEFKQNNELLFPTFNTNKGIAVLFDDILAVPTHFIVDIKNKKMNKTMGLLDENQLANLMRMKQ
jgi:thiol-disulfide isomerase/thioredoxin